MNTCLPVWMLLLSLLIKADCKAQADQFISWNDRHIIYEGRIGKQQPGYAALYWAGSAIQLNFEGTGIDAVMKDEKAANYYYIVLDQGEPVKIKIDSVKKSYTLAEHLAGGKHSIQLFKCTQWDKGKTFFYGFILPRNGKAIYLPAGKKRKIEFYGNSITCGSAVEDTTGKDSGESKYENNWLSYAALTARHYGAAYSCIARSGIGLVISWFPLTMPQMYNRLDPADPGSKWDFKKFRPDIVVVNLLQNDSWLVKKPDHEQFKIKFGDTPPPVDLIISSYKKFIGSLREKYPRAKIICVLGNMDAAAPGSVWPGYIRKAVALLGDKKVYTCFFAYKNTPGHPNKKEQQEMADSLAGFIDRNIRW